MNKVVATIAILFIAGCGSDPSECERAAERLGTSACSHRIADDTSWQSVTVPVSLIDQVRTTRYLVPARDDARLPTLVIDSNTFELHFPFMREAFGHKFPALTLAEYAQLITSSQNREFFAGPITEYMMPGGGRSYGFVVWDEGNAAGAVTCAQFQQVHAALSNAVALQPLVAIPAADYQLDILNTCDVPSYDPSTAVEYEAYTRGIGYGTVRRYTLSQLDAAVNGAELGWRDIVVIDQAPFDIETVISGAVTGTRQGELSHLNVRSAARGTPNCYAKNAHELLADFEGKLVRLECARNQLHVSETTLAEAEDWWSRLRPDPVTVPTPDVAHSALIALADMPTESTTDRAVSLSRYGAKARNLASLYQRIDKQFQLDGFAIPFHYYDAFMAARSWTFDFGSGAQVVTFAETINRFIDHDGFRSDGALRRLWLDQLRVAMRASPCDNNLLLALDAQIRTTFGGTDVMVRFRSSSNAEDALNFNGAGLYSSTSACLADDLDADTLGPSRCDPDKLTERTMCRALNKVWASLWNPKAFEEREWYGIDQHSVAMAILVNTRTKGELANIVAFSGIPGDGDDKRYLVNAQLGELDVVSPDPGVWPEKDLLTITGGAVTTIERARSSSQTSGPVLSDDQLRLLGATMATIVQTYPVDGQVPANRTLLLDSEWKIRADGQLIVKQVRPFSSK